MANPAFSLINFVFSIFIVTLVVSSLGFSLNISYQPNVFAANPFPQPYFTSPANNEFMSTVDPNFVKIYDKQVNIRVVDLAENNILYTTFDYSSDGILWIPIGDDINPEFEGI